MTEAERLKYSQWVLERNLSWLSSAEVKVGVIVTIDTGMLGALATAFGSLNSNHGSPAIYGPTIVAAVMLGLGIACASGAVLPRLQGPKASFIFFGKIVVDQPPDFIDKFKNATDEQLLNDCLAQIHRNAEIAFEKFSWVRKAMFWSFSGVIPWLVAICLVHWK